METRILIPPSLSLVVCTPSRDSKDPHSEKSRNSKRKLWKSKELERKASSGQSETRDFVDKLVDKIEDDDSVDVDKRDKDKGLSGRRIREQRRGSSEEETETEILKTSSSSSSSSESSDKSDSETSSEVEAKSIGIRKRKSSGLKQTQNSVRLCSKEFIDKGTIFGPNDGEIRILFLDSVPNLPKDDIRFNFGCFDRITEDPLDEDKEIRLCNWIRFMEEGKFQPSESEKEEEEDISSSDDLNNSFTKNKANLTARFVDGKPEFEFTERVVPGTEIVAFFDTKSIHTTQSPHLSINRSQSDKNDLTLDNRTHLHHFQTFIKIKTEGLDEEDSPDSDGPLDLSKSLPLTKTPNPKSTSANAFRIKTEAPFESPDSEKSFRYFETASKPQLFSISNVLQSAKIFQPYSLSIGNPVQKSLFSPTSGQNSNFNNSKSVGNNLITINSSLATPNSMRSSSSSGSPGRNSSPLNQSQHNHLHANNGPVLIRPILRTRGRERSLLPCEVCGKAFDRPSLLKRHMRTHTGEKPHVCDVCSKGFSTSSSLNTHRRIHSGEKPHQCPICGKRFTASSNLYYHRMTHNKEKPHKCMLCGKSFPTPGDLKSHQYVHSGSWPYNCPVCHRGFSKQTNLRNHLLLHSGDKPHNCHICGKKFALACNLRAHLRTHEEEPISSCIACKRSFLTSLNMLVNGYCRSCLLTSSTKPPSSEARIGGNSSSRKSISPPQAPSSTDPVTSLPSMAIPTTLTSIPGFHIPGPPLGASGNHASLFPGGSLSTGTNPFLEQLFEWNYRFAKETAGNLNIMQQKLLESQMLAAQLMIGSSNPPAFGVGISDLLRLRPQDFNGMDLNKFIQQ